MGVCTFVCGVLQSLHNPRDSSDMKHDQAMEVSAGLSATATDVGTIHMPSESAPMGVSGGAGGAGTAALLPDLDDLFGTCHPHWAVSSSRI